jgi:small-conductance mechanosensitive channel
VSSIIAGIVAVYERPYRTGDWVKIDDAYGEIRSMGLRALEIVTPDDTVVSIPHAKLWDSNIYNDTDGGTTLLCVANFYLQPNHDAARIREALGDVALTSPFLSLERPVVVVLSEKPWGTHYRLKAYPIDGRDQFQFVSDLTVRGQIVLAALGAEPVVTAPAVSSESGS